MGISLSKESYGTGEPPSALEKLDSFNLYAKEGGDLTIKEERGGNANM